MTLVEMMVSMALLAILIGGVFTIVGTSLNTVLIVSNDASRRDQVMNFYSVLRRSFRTLPSSARIEARHYTTDQDEQLLLAVKDAPGMLSWNNAQAAGGEMVLLTTLPQSTGGLRVAMRRFVPPRSLPLKMFDPVRLLDFSAEQPWLTLLPDVRFVRWRFLKLASQEWSSEWTDADLRPVLIELTVGLAESDDPERSVNWLPPITPVTPEPTATGGRS
jgi:hypothetical protein